jgi:hypothetical protein
MKEFWVASGHHLLDRAEGGGLAVTDDFLKAYFARPELLPPEDACPAERALHGALLADPRRPVGPKDIARLADADARENWAVVIAFRDHLLRHPTLEAAYLALVRDGMGGTPHLFVNHLVHLILRNALEGSEDAYLLRAAELLFRPQKLSQHEGTVLLADEEVIERLEPGAHGSPLLAMMGGAEAAIEVLNDDNARTYQSRSDGFDMALDFGTGRPGRAAFARVLERFLAHLVGIRVTIEPVAAFKDERLRWFVGLDAEATRIGNALWRGEDVDAAALDRVAALFHLRFSDPAEAPPELGGGPVHLILAATPDRVVRVKPQNLIAGLPARRAALAS